MKAKIDTAFGVNTCHQDINCFKFGIIDDSDSDPCRITYDGIQHFLVKNSQEDCVNFLATDKCLYKGSPDERCDFIIFNNKCFCFGEIKRTDNRGKSKFISKSIAQLETTIQDFLKNIDFKDYILEAYIAFLDKKPVPSSTNFQNAKLLFWEEYQVSLFDENEKHF